MVDKGGGGCRTWGPPLSDIERRLAVADLGAESAARQRQGSRTLIKPHLPPVNIIGGYKFENAPKVTLR